MHRDIETNLIFGIRLISEMAIRTPTSVTGTLTVIGIRKQKLRGIEITREQQ
jgi:hypothetical protein